MKPCPSCKADAGVIRRGTLGEEKGVWCTACGFKTTTVNGWELRPTPVHQPIYVHPDASRGPDGSVPYIVLTSQGSILDRIAQTVFGLTRRIGEGDEEFRQRLCELYRRTAPTQQTGETPGT